MAYFVTTYRYTDDDTTRDEVRPTHRAYLEQLTEQDQLAVSGPYVGGEQAGAMLIFIADSEAEARDLSAHDPFVLRGLVADVTVREWKPVSGTLAQHF